MSIADKAKQLQQFVTYFMLLREVLKNEELRKSLAVVVDTLEETFKKVPGEFPENMLNSLQGLLKLEDDTDVPDEDG